MSDILAWAKRERERVLGYVNPPPPHVPTVTMREHVWLGMLDALIAREEALLMCQSYFARLDNRQDAERMTLKALAVDPRPEADRG